MLYAGGPPDHSTDCIAARVADGMAQSDAAVSKQPTAAELFTL